MEYTKKPLSLDEQVDKLAGRGLIIDDKELAERYLPVTPDYKSGITWGDGLFLPTTRDL